MAAPKNKRYAQHNERSAEDRALDRFAEMMIEKIKTIDSDWKKTWFTESALQWPTNLSGRRYNGLNALMLMFHCENEGYRIPVFMTFERISSLNFTNSKKGERKPLSDENGEKLPFVSIQKGAKSFPVFLTTFTVIHSENKQKISYDDYKKLSDKEKSEYTVYPKLQVFNVFNIDQTNLQESHPELYERIREENQGIKPQNADEMFRFPALDEMINNNGWLCPIYLRHQDQAYYSQSRDEIVLPEKEQFSNGEAFYGAALHEIIHSTGIEERLGRFESGSTSDLEEYAEEELTAELGSALIASRFGFAKNIKEDSCAYLKSWLDKLKESPEFIKNVLIDVKKATNMVIGHIEAINQQLSGSIPEDKMPLLPVTAIPEQVSVQYLMTDAESTRAIYDLLPEKSIDSDSVSINEQENSLTVEGADPEKLTEFLENNLDGETFSKIIKVSPLYEGHPIELIGERNTKSFQLVLDKLRGNSKWLKKNGLHGYGSMNVSVSNAAIGYFLVTMQSAKGLKAGIMDYTGEVVLPFTSYKKGQKPEEIIDLDGEILRRVESAGTESIDPMGRIEVAGVGVKDENLQGTVYPLIIDGETEASLLIPNDKDARKDYRLWLDSSSNGEEAEPTRSMEALLSMKDGLYAPRVITEMVNSPLDKYLQQRSKLINEIVTVKPEQQSPKYTDEAMGRISNIRIEQRGERREEWISADIDGVPVLSEKLSEKEYRDVMEGVKTEKEIAAKVFDPYLQKQQEEKHVAMGV